MSQFPHAQVSPHLLTCSSQYFSWRSRFNLVGKLNGKAGKITFQPLGSRMSPLSHWKELKTSILYHKARWKPQYYRTPQCYEHTAECFFAYPVCSTWLWASTEPTLSDWKNFQTLVEEGIWPKYNRSETPNVTYYSALECEGSEQPASWVEYKDRARKLPAWKESQCLLYL